MVGNKCDMAEERVIPPEKGKHLADQLGEPSPGSRRRSRAASGRSALFFYGSPWQPLFPWSTLRGQLMAVVGHLIGKLG